MNSKLIPLRIFQILTKPFKGRKVFGRQLGNFWLIEFCYENIRRLLIPKNVISEINGYKIKTNFGIGGIARLIVEEHKYEPKTTQVFEKYATHGRGAIIDVGANIGYYTLLAAKLLASETKLHPERQLENLVYAFEPESSNSISLQENINLNHFINCKVFPMALSDKAGNTLLYTSDKESGEHNIIGSHGLKETNTDAYNVFVDTLDNLWFSGNTVPVRLVKIDVEGAEVKVLRGGERLFKQYHPTLIVECWEEGLNVAGNTIEELIALICSYNYHLIYMIDEFENKSYDVTPNLIREYYQKHHFSVNLYAVAEQNLRELTVDRMNRG